MENNYHIISLDEASAPNGAHGGGKFAGLTKIKPLLEQYQAQFGFDFAVPQTYAIPITAFATVQKLGHIPDELVNEAMQYAVKLGGNVAVRSSADIEDRQGKTCSGQFESVLNVKNKAQMAAALNRVYASAQNVPDTAMGIILQKMVDTPQMAGVVYSETFYGAPFVVMNYTENNFADKLLNNQTSGQYFAVSKPLLNRNDKMVRLNLSTLNNPAYQMLFCPSAFDASPRPATVQNRQTYRRHFQLAALAMQLEQDLGHPVDMEFAIAPDGRVNILQCRPYCLPQFYEKQIDAHTNSVFSLEKPYICGNVGFVNRPHPLAANKDFEVNIWKSGETVHIFNRNSVGVHQRFMFDWFNSPFDANYNHHGNMSRENIDFSVLETTGRAQDFAHIKEGDYMWLNLLNGEFIVHPKEKTQDIALTKMLMSKLQSR